MISEFFIKKPNDLMKKSVVYNLAANLLNAAVSVFLLLFVTRSCGTTAAGIFSIGFSTAQMMLPIGQYGMRNYQASDVIGKYEQEDYIASRIITNIIMMAGAIGFVLVKGYFFEKAMILVLLCLLKVTDAFDDVFGGYYQLNNRLDISGKMQLIRIGLYCIAFVLTVTLTKNVLLACAVAFAVSAVVLIAIVSMVKRLFPVTKPKFRWDRLKKLLIDCLPLCISAFLVLYMGNAPKYAIDSYMSSDAQAIYNYLFMPCYVICLFVSFVLQPLLVKMSKTWVNRDFIGFKKITVIICAATLLLSIFVIIVGHFLGCPVLGWLYGVDLGEYQYPFTVLLVGGAGYAFAVILQTILTVMRHQYVIMIGFAVSGILITVLSPMLVSAMGITGAAYSYITASLVLAFIMLICMIGCFKREERKNKINSNE